MRNVFRDYGSIFPEKKVVTVISIVVRVYWQSCDAFDLSRGLACQLIRVEGRGRNLVILNSERD